MTKSATQKKEWTAYNAHDGVTLKRWRVGDRARTPGIICPVAIIANEDEDVPGTDQAENAYLIAAAPDMLAALESLFEHCSMTHSRWGDGCNRTEADAAIAAAHAAIAKAQGHF